ncbi:hypothetical protein [Streptacidiphilus sp. MAP5-52]|uniref:hypothetical protein n=1 Tax=Streptacidiphilus sp. MAP5-52 TaxID=3156267 RepID=UPI0035171A0A
MSRIRTIKPELFCSESLSRVTVNAERTFIGLFSVADDRGRFRDDARIIYGRLWVTRTEQTPAGVEDDLRQLEAEGLICRYAGCDGKRYLHIVTWDKHQKISHPTASRLSACPEHQASQDCGGCKAKHCSGPSPENFRRPQPQAAEVPSSDQQSLQERADAEPLSAAPAAHPPASGQEMPGHDVSAEALRNSSEELATGSRILDPGSTPNGGGDAAPRTPGRLIAEYKGWFPSAPPRALVDRLGKEIKNLQRDGFTDQHIREGLREFANLPGMGPSLLPSLVHAAANGSAAVPTVAAGTGRHRGWTNPTSDAYDEDL